MLEITTLDDNKRTFIPEKHDTCRLNQLLIHAPECKDCVYATETSNGPLHQFKCSIGKYWGECDAFVDKRQSVPLPPVKSQRNNDIFVDILGSKWTIRFTTEKDEPRLNGCDGFTDWTEKLIGIENGLNGNIGNKQKYTEKLIRHEVIHAFLFESGLGDSMEHREYGHDETTIDWFAYQIDKINDVVMEVMKSMTL